MFGFLIGSAVVGYGIFKCFKNQVQDEVRRSEAKEHSNLVYTDSHSKLRFTKDDKPIHLCLKNGHTVYAYDDGTVAYDTVTARKNVNKEKAMKEGRYFYLSSGDKTMYGCLVERRVSDDMVFVVKGCTAWPGKETEDIFGEKMYVADTSSSWYLKMVALNKWERVDK